MPTDDEKEEGLLVHRCSQQCPSIPGFPPQMFFWIKACLQGHVHVYMNGAKNEWNHLLMSLLKLNLSERCQSQLDLAMPREASTLIFKIRSCIVRSDLQNKHEISRKCLIFKICSYSARSDLKKKSACVSRCSDSCMSCCAFA